MISAASLSIDEAIGQLICPTLYGGQLRHETFDEATVLAELAKYGWGGYILFHSDQDTVQARTALLQGHARVPLLIAADMEHGAGQMVDGLTDMPPAMAFGAVDDPALTAAMGAWTAAEARQVGVNWLFAPVADVTNNPSNPIISIRSFGGDPGRVAAHVAAFVTGAQSQGVLTCAKHFPGHGDTGTDSHTRLATVTADRERLTQVEWPPFQAAIDAGVAAIMTAHLAVPALDAPDVPATLSQTIITGVLREDLGYDGLIVTDALLMGGITSVRQASEAAVEALLAGCDVLLMPPDPIATHAAIRAALADGRLTEARLYESVTRILAAKARLQHPVPAVPDGSAGALAANVARKAITRAKGAADLRVPDGFLAVTLLDGIAESEAEAWLERIKELRPGIIATLTPDVDERMWNILRGQAISTPFIVLAIISPIRVSKDRSLLPSGLLERLQALTAGVRTIVVAFSSPFLVAQFPDAEAWFLTYGSTRLQQTMMAQALRDGKGWHGTLPVALPEMLAGVETVSSVPADSKGPAFA
ncbi:MAG: beta-glucosidase [Candidatus Sericytochromatia bacterium]|nr:beta-glucosidase [Candidatus Sericytochromatia bacterium]